MKTPALFHLIVGWISLWICANTAAEVISDGTMGRSGSISGPDYQITSDYGRQHGANLFHSFQTFNLGQGERATFSGPSEVRNIISRVTGGDVSRIDGTLASQITGADLFFLNPAGVIFGPHAALDITGSFHVSTGDYIRLGSDDGIFYANSASDSILSSAPPTSFGFLDATAAPIRFEADNHPEPSDDESPSGIQVVDGKRLTVVAGDVDIQQTLTAAMGQIQVTSVASPGQVSVDTSTNQATDVDAHGHISLTNKAELTTSGDDGSGGIYIRAGQFYVDQSRVTAENNGSGPADEIRIEADQVTFANGSVLSVDAYGEGDGADIDIRASDTVAFTGANGTSSNIYAGSYDEGDTSGNSGNVHIQANTIRFDNGSRISSESYGAGNCASVTLDARESVRFSGHDAHGQTAGIFGITMGEEDSAGHAGRVSITAAQMHLEDGAWINISSNGAGQGGDVEIHATESVNLSGISERQIGSRIATSSENTISGPAGNIRITTGSLTARDGALIDSSVFGWGDGGDISLTAIDAIRFLGYDGTGQGSGIIARTQGQETDAGNAGSVTIHAGRVAFADGAWIGNTTDGVGKGGDVVIRATEDVTFSGVDGNGRASRIYADTRRVADEGDAGDAGSIDIQAKQVTFSDGAGITAATMGMGNGGTIRIQAKESVALTGANPHGVNVDGLGSNISTRSLSDEPDGGDAGTIEIITTDLMVTDGSFIASGTAGGGKAGPITIEASQSLSISGYAPDEPPQPPLASQQEFSQQENTDPIPAFSGIYSRTIQSEDYGGDGQVVQLTAGTLSLSNGAVISTTSYGGGKAADLIMTADQVNMTGGDAGTTGIFTTSESEESISGDAGNVLISANRLTLSNGAIIDSETWGGGNGGDVDLQITDSVIFSGIGEDGTSSGIAAFANGYEEESGNAGNVTIHTRELKLDQGAYISSASNGMGKGGDITLTATDAITLSGVGKDGRGCQISSSAETADSQKAGDIRIETNRLHLDDGALIQSDTVSEYAEGTGGDVVIDAESIVFSGVNEEGQGSGMIARSTGVSEDAGKAGDIRIITGTLEFRDGAWIGNTSDGGGQGGAVTIQARDGILFSGTDGDGIASRIYTTARAGENDPEFADSAGNAGDIDLHAKSIVFKDGGGVTASTTGWGNGGNVRITASDRIELIGGNPYGENSDGFGSGVYARTEGKFEGAGDAGDISIQTDRLIITNGAVITNSTLGGGNRETGEHQVTTTIEARQIWMAGTGSADPSLDPLSSQEAFMTEARQQGIVPATLFYSAISSASKSPESFAGIAGKIQIKGAETIRMYDRAAITTAAENANGGQIDIEVRDHLHLSHSQITSSVRGGADDAANIDIDKPLFLTMNRSDIIAQAYGGNGGNITIAADYFIQSIGSQVDASSKLGIDGQVRIDSPDVDVSSGLTVLPTGFLDATRWMDTPCEIRSGENQSRFVIRNRDGIPFPLGGVLSSPLP